VTTEFAGAIDLEPPMTTQEIAYVRRLSQSGKARGSWVVARDGASVRPRRSATVDGCEEALRFLIGSMARSGRWRGTVAVFDTDSRELVAISASKGRVTRRVLRKAPGAAKPRTNVIDLASRRRSASRAIS
jgi:hypothetical protein